MTPVTFSFFYVLLLFSAETNTAVPAPNTQNMFMTERDCLKARAYAGKMEVFSCQKYQGPEKITFPKDMPGTG